MTASPARPGSPRSCLLLFALLLGVLPAGCTRERSDPVATAQAARIEADLRVLADDRMQGRAAGTPGHERAARYVAARFHAAGLQPAGDGGGWCQRVPLLRARRVDHGGELVVDRGGRRIALRWREQFLPELGYDQPRARVHAPVVFVGQGVHAPDLGRDDLAGVDLHGRIALLLGGAPASLPADARAFHATPEQKLRDLAAAGAIGAVFIASADDQRAYPWRRAAATWARPGLELRGDDGRGLDRLPSLRVVATASSDAAEVLLGGGGRNVAALMAAAIAGRQRGFDLPGTITLAARTAIEPLDSCNVVARLPGRDPARSEEHVVLSAHLDHLGMRTRAAGEPASTDVVYNGALDNALGVAVMLEASRQLAARPASRPLLFVATTAEESGLLGARWFARHPPRPRATLIADINLDMPLLLAPTDDAVVIGAARSSLQAIVQEAARAAGVALSPDPMPQQHAELRSDQYAFVRAGIPALLLDGGVDATHFGDDARAGAETFLRERYHRPGDDADQPVAYNDAARLARLAAAIARGVAEARVAPTWQRGDFFGDRFGGAPSANQINPSPPPP